MSTEIRLTETFQQQCWELDPATHLFGFIAKVVVQGTKPFKMDLHMTKEMDLQEVIKPALERAEKRHCILDKVVFVGAVKAVKKVVK